MSKRLKRLLRLRNSSGFTLVEVIIACALLGILIVGVMGFITPVLSSIREKEKNARAVLLTKAVDEYIASTIQYAYFVSTFSGAANGDTSGASPKVVSSKYNGSEFAKKQNKGLETLKSCFNNMKADTFEIRCIGVRWRDDGTTGEKKLMLTNESVDQTTLALDPAKSRLVFEECFYDGLYPLISFGNYSNQYQIGGENRVEDSKVDIAPGLMITTDVYTNLDCYNVTDTVRADSMLTYTEVSYAGFNNIKSSLINKGEYEVIPNIEVRTYDEALGEDAGLTFEKDGQEYYYPESFIYYIVRKTKV